MSLLQTDYFILIVLNCHTKAKSCGFPIEGLGNLAMVSGWTEINNIAISSSMPTVSLTTVIQ